MAATRFASSPPKEKDSSPPKKKAAPGRAKRTRPAAPAAATQAGAFDVRPVTGETWPDFATLFGARGAPHYCWCSPYRFRDAHEMSHDEKRAAMQRLVRAATPIGVIAYEGQVPVGWCSVAPRETYVKLDRSRTMPRVSAAPTWTVLCFFVPRPHRGRGVSRALLAGALAEARRHGAAVVEGYPYDTAGISSTHRGHSSTFRALGFEQNGRRWSYELATMKSA